jgi:hypothetical protein
MATWYVAKFSSNHIWSIEVERETDQCVWVHFYNKKQTTRQAKDGAYERYCPTWEAAREALITRRQSDVDAASHRLQVAESELGNVKGMKKPEGA